MDEPLYDEFGNYIGPDVEEDDDVDDEEAWYNQADLKPRDEMDEDEPDHLMEDQPAHLQQSIVLHEDKKYYPSASEVFPDAETLVEDEDNQPLTEPIIKPIKKKTIGLEDTIPATTFNKEFLSNLTQFPELIRNVVVAGSLHHGKTIFLDMLVQQTHDKKWNISKNIRYTDTLKIEQERGLSIKMTPMTLVLETLAGKSYLINLADTPGHVNFSDEVTAAIRISDGMVLLVDAVEGVTMQTKRLIKHAILERLPIVLVINKLDRLILELKIPPRDAYYKLKYIIDQVNQALNEIYQSWTQPEDTTQQAPPRISPELGNVCFASGEMGWCFSLKSFAEYYAELYSFPANLFAPRLWGDVWYVEGKFLRKVPADLEVDRTFVSFILEPIYKIYSHVLAEEPSELKRFLDQLGIQLTREQYKLDTFPLLKLVLSLFFGRASAFVDMLVEHVPSPVQASKSKIPHIYTGPMNALIAQSMLSCDPNGPLVIHITKLIAKTDGSGFDAFGRIFSGTVEPETTVKILGEGYSLDDEEDMVVKDVENLWISEARYRIGMDHLSAGNWVLLGGVDDSIMKTATIVGDNISEDLYIFRALKFNTISAIKLAVEPLNPAELPKMLDGLRKINKSYPLVTTKAEESGEHVVFGTGELYLDCIMHDLRKVFADIEVKVADPVVSFCETVIETSAVKCFAETPNRQNKLTMIAEPLEKGIAEDIERQAIRLDWGRQKVSKFFQEHYDWDLLASKNIWAFGPDPLCGPNVLLDDTIPTEVDPGLLSSVRESIVHGFQWGVRDGPLCEEPIRNVKFKLLDAGIAKEVVNRSGAQIIPTARRVIYSSFLMATPRLMEPVFLVDILTPEDSIIQIYKVLTRRRGHVSSESPIPGTPLYSVVATVPVIESFGFETDIRTHTAGQAFCVSVFDHWQLVPGDPLDKKIELRPLMPSPLPHLAREFMVKTRRRKGLSDDVSVNQFFDEQMTQYLKEEYEDIDAIFS